MLQILRNTIYSSRPRDYKTAKLFQVLRRFQSIRHPPSSEGLLTLGHMLTRQHQSSHLSFKMPYRFLASLPVPKRSPTSSTPRTVEKHSHSLTSRPVWRHSDSEELSTPWSEASPVSETPSKLGGAFQNTEATSLRRFQTVVRPRNSDALSGHRHKIDPLRGALHVETPLQSLTCFELKVPSKNTSQFCFVFVESKSFQPALTIAGHWDAG